MTDVSVLQPLATNEKVARVGLYYKIPKGTHIYWKNGGEIALPTNISLKAPNGWTLGEIKWPTPFRFTEKGGVIAYGYEDEVLLFADLFYSPAQDFVEQNYNDLNRVSSLKIEAETSWLECEVQCLPGSKNLELEIQVDKSKPLAASPDINTFVNFDKKIPQELDPTLLKEVEFNFKDSFGEVLILIDKAQLKKQLGVEGESLLNYAGLMQVFPHYPIDQNSVADSGVKFEPATIEYFSKDELLVRLPFLVSSKEFLPNSISGEIVFNQKSFSWLANKKDSSATKFSQSLFNQREKLVFRWINHDQMIRTSTASLGLMLIGAFFGGILLNFFPCVLPMLSIKIFGVLKSNILTKRQSFLGAVLFALGVIVTLNILSLCIFALRLSGEEIGWGFQFQEPRFLVFMILTVFIFALSFFGLFDIDITSSRFIQKLSNADIKGYYQKSFIEGALTAILTTPCTGPFLGSVLALALSANWITGIFLFSTIGLGISLPYLILSISPKLVSKLPKPGPWMDKFKEVMGFSLLLTVGWLITVLSEVNQSYVNKVIFYVIFIFAFFWIRKWFKNKLVKFYIPTIFILFIYVLSIFSFKNEGNLLLNWQPYSEMEIIKATNSKRKVFIDFTADWCLTCKLNESLVLNTEEVQAYLTDNNILAIKADWTKRDPELTAALAKYNSVGVPLYVYIDAEGKVKILPTILTKRMILSLDKK